jgi:hypothetical protein
MVDTRDTDDSALSEFETENKSPDKQKIYSKIPKSDDEWLEEKAHELGGTKSEIIRRLVYQARLKDSDEELLGL